MTDQSDQNAAAKKSPGSAAEGAIQQLDELLPIDDFEEEVEIGDVLEKRKGIYILPNLFTSAALFAGFYSILSSMQGHFEAAAIAIFVATPASFFIKPVLNP